MARLQLWQYNGCIETQVETSGQVGDQLQSDESMCSSLLRVISCRGEPIHAYRAYSYMCRKNQVNRSKAFEFRARANKQTNSNSNVITPQFT